ncbi:recombinase family protein [Sphingobium yanoikuyae]|uniref:Recombinase family protein n=1 Tax=Sphingobium yanoikuyae TaxID=13690 RepID=A0A6P1GGA8_SPHYA|nr:recombinase family protein [Sphingobium yanoikuyae]QHD67420.1 recombinase family protein [Sphingobium yanoikuyae]RSU74038.1 resolvase [Sphingomonas sp. S-NIH.Pt3_0716]
MAEGKFCAYYRVSTQKQGRSGLGLEAQQKAVADYLNGGAWELSAEFTEIESGRNVEREELAKALRHCELTGATLVVAKLDRLSRDAVFLLTLQKSPVKIIFADMPFADKMMIGIMAIIAEWEAEQISRRTKAALAAAKARGVKLGGDRGNVIPAQKGAALSAKNRSRAADERAAKVMHYVEEAKAAGHTSLRQIASYLDHHGVTTPRGKQWTAAAVSSLIARSSA